ncbi:MAG: VOC family protein [Methylacidiphilales bacterium]|nr:VOC family protein [Candidatus Methylacidiphilales bacterium]
MIKVNEAAFFAYPVTDMARARKFYEDVLGLKVSQEPTTVPWMEFDLGNATLGLGSYDGWSPSKDGAMLALEVDDFEKSLSELQKAGASFHLESMETPVCYFAIIRDPDGNAVMIHKRKPGHG